MAVSQIRERIFTLLPQASSDERTVAMDEARHFLRSRIGWERRLDQLEEDARRVSDGRGIAPQSICG